MKTKNEANPKAATQHLNTLPIIHRRTQRFEVFADLSRVSQIYPNIMKLSTVAAGAALLNTAIGSVEARAGQTNYYNVIELQQEEGFHDQALNLSEFEGSSGKRSRTTSSSSSDNETFMGSSSMTSRDSHQHQHQHHGGRHPGRGRGGGRGHPGRGRERGDGRGGGHGYEQFHRTKTVTSRMPHGGRHPGRGRGGGRGHPGRGRGSGHGRGGGDGHGYQS
eukprot:scaffold170_cov129-Skeletonema_dohrnii-CCMP3373.AAC.8